MRTRRRLSRFGSGIFTLAVLFVVLPLAAEGQAPRRGGTLRVAYGNEILGMDFYTTPGYEMAWVAMNVGCGLVSITPEGKFIPEAGESWQASSDGLLYQSKIQ